MLLGAGRKLRSFSQLNGHAYREGNDLSSTGLEVPSFPKLLSAMVFATAISYYGQILPQMPISNSTSAKCACNAEIRVRHKRGESGVTLAEVFGISEQRVWQIVRGSRK